MECCLSTAAEIQLDCGIKDVAKLHEAERCSCILRSQLVCVEVAKAGLYDRQLCHLAAVMRMQGHLTCMGCEGMSPCNKESAMSARALHSNTLVHLQDCAVD